MTVPLLTQPAAYTQPLYMSQSIIKQPKSHLLASTRNVQHSPATVVNQVRKHLTVNWLASKLAHGLLLVAKPVNQFQSGLTHFKVGQVANRVLTHTYYEQ